LQSNKILLNLISLYKSSFSNLEKNIWILSFASFINRSGSMVLLFTSLYLTKELHFSISQAGLIMSMYGIGSIIGSYLGGWLTDRINFFYLLVFSQVVSGLILLLMIVGKTALEISAIVFFYALVADVFRPANSTAIATFSNPANRTRSFSLVRLAVNLGFSVGPAVGGFVALHLGYHLLFVIDAVTSICAGIMLFFVLPKTNSLHQERNKDETKVKSMSAYRDTEYLKFIFFVAIYGIIFFQIFASVPQFFSRELGYGEDLIGLLMAFNGLLVVLVEMPIVGILEKKNQNFKFIIWGVWCLPLCFLFLLFGKGMLIWAVVYTIVITLSEIFAMPFMMNYALSKPPKERQGQYSALYSIAYGIANIAAPSVGLGIADNYGFNAMFYVLIVISILCYFGFRSLKKTEKIIHT
jgi:predicted MFS family arabinose efflux permease